MVRICTSLSLPRWDGVPRVDTLLVDYLGADNAYTRAVTRKALCAAATRIWTPGVKCDHIIALNGSLGIGKSARKPYNNSKRSDRKSYAFYTPMNGDAVNHQLFASRTGNTAWFIISRIAP